MKYGHLKNKYWKFTKRRGTAYHLKVTRTLQRREAHWAVAEKGAEQKLQTRKCSHP
jgi:hypothetical protein